MANFIGRYNIYSASNVGVMLLFENSYSNLYVNLTKLSYFFSFFAVLIHSLAVTQFDDFARTFAHDLKLAMPV